LRSHRSRQVGVNRRDFLKPDLHPAALRTDVQVVGPDGDSKGETPILIGLEGIRRGRKIVRFIESGELGRPLHINVDFRAIGGLAREGIGDPRGQHRSHAGLLTG
jgi:hypothetical protein